MQELSDNLYRNAKITKTNCSMPHGIFNVIRVYQLRIEKTKKKIKTNLKHGL